MTKTVFILAGGKELKSEGYGRRLHTEIAKYVKSKYFELLFFGT